MSQGVSTRKSLTASIPAVWRAHWRWMIPVAILLVWVASQLIVFAMAGQFAFPLDDAYIVLHNARSLVAGDDNFANAPPLSGVTSLLHTLVVTPLTLVLPGPLTLWLLGWLGILAAALGFDRLARNSGCGWRMRLAIVAAALLAGEPLLIMLNGVETGWAIAAAAWVLALAASPGTDRRLAILCGLLPFVRPELGALGALVMLDQAWRRYRAAGNLRACAGEVAKDFLVLAAVSLPLLAIQWLGSGGPLPNTADAKRYFFADHLRPLATRVSLVIASLGYFALTLGPVFLSIFLIRTRTAALGAGFAVIVLIAFAMVLPAGGFYNDHRYLYILLPAMAAGLAGALNSGHRGWRVAATVILVAGVAWNLVTLPGGARNYAERAVVKLNTMSGLADWIEANLGPEETLLLHDIGYVAYATGQPLEDMVGLKSPENIDIHRRYAAPPYADTDNLYSPPPGDAGWGESIERIALRSGARILVVSTGFEKVFRIAGGLGARGWTLEPLARVNFYDIYRIAPPGKTPDGN